jgi:purine-binding chemotaxis protein CheW
MGRMSDARKRAQQKQAGGGDGPDEPVKPAVAPPAPPVVPAPPAPPPDDEPAVVFDDEPDDAPRWVSREETLTFPAERAPAPVEAAPVRDVSASAAGGRIALPSSGLASDILARHEAMHVEPLPRVESLPSAPEAPAAPVPFQNVAFFGPQSREDRKVTVEPMEHLVTFFLADEEYGLDVRVVQEIIRVAEITHVPRAPEFIKGVINLRGRIIPVVDLKRKLELGEVVPSRLSRIVVVKLRDRLVGLLADGASQVLKIPVSSVDAAPEEILDVNVSFIRGVAKLEKRLIILLDLQKILAVEIEHAAAQ